MNMLSPRNSTNLQSHSRTHARKQSICLETFFAKIVVRGKEHACLGRIQGGDLVHKEGVHDLWRTGDQPRSLWKLRAALKVDVAGEALDDPGRSTWGGLAGAS